MIDADRLAAGAKAEIVRRATLEREGSATQCRVVPFVPGRRPAAEAAHPGLGSSADVALVLPGAELDRAFILYDVDGGPSCEIRATVSFAGPDGSLPPVTVPGWARRTAPALAFVEGSDGGPEPQAHARRRVLQLTPAHDLLPGPEWAWEEIDPALRDGATGGADPFTFGHLFSQRVRVELAAFEQDVPIAGDRADLLVCDLRRCGSLYARLLDDLVRPDAATQAAEAGCPDPGAAYHPWFPVLKIGGDKADLYTRALIQDIAFGGEHLADPGWLVRVGLYLEFLTFLGIVEAVKDDHGDLLTPAERKAFETQPWFEPIRKAVDPQAWREVWELRRIQLPRRGTPRTGPVSARNLLAKKKATLRFLHVHHDDLKHAIRLAGPNRHNAQETWQRVFRDAERAVLRNVRDAFPELAELPPAARDFVLWHRKGRFEHVRVPGSLSGLLADQDGLFGSACNQYRDSMNDVAEWAKRRDLMDHTGQDCVPRQVSLLEAHVNQPARVALLQHHDGYGPELEVGAELPATYRRPAEEIRSLLEGVPVLAVLEADERNMLARTARPLTLGPTERLVVQGQPGGSLFVLAEGEVEVWLRRDGEDILVDTMGKGAVVGEMSLLTGEPRTATVRAVEGAVVYEIGRRQYAPVLERHPDLVDVLARLMVKRLEARRTRLEADKEHAALVRQIRRMLRLAPR